MDLDDYTTTYYSKSASFGYGRSNSAALGNPGDCLTADFATQQSGTTAVREFLTFEGFEYNPSTQGAVSTIDFSLDRRWTKVQGNWNFTGATSIFTVLQGDRLFFASDTVTYTLGTWITFDRTVAASDFREFDLTVGSSKDGVPDFSSSGEALRFGLLVGWQWSNPSGSSLAAREDTDNFEVSVNPVPEPSSLALLGLGLTRFRKRKR